MDIIQAIIFTVIAVGVCGYISGKQLMYVIDEIVEIIDSDGGDTDDVQS